MQQPLPRLSRQPAASSVPRSSARQRRRGWATLWLIIWLPALLVLLSALLGIANLWLARVELETALEAAALAAVKEWGDQGGGETFIPRQVGVEFAAANCVRGVPVAIDPNYDGPLAALLGQPLVRLASVAPVTGCNENRSCTLTASPPGNLVFGAISEDDPDNVMFNAGECPSCNPGRVLIDATAQGAGNLSQDNAWGIAFLREAGTPNNLRIRRIVIDLQASGGTGVFNLGGLNSTLGPTITDNIAPHAVAVSCPGPVDEDQPDLVGFTEPDEQILFTPTSGQSPTLTIDFFPDEDPEDGTDDGFAPCDRFRFGAAVSGVGNASRRATDDDDGDGIGSDRAVVTIYFELGGIPLPPFQTTFFDNDEKSNERLCPPETDPECGDLIVHPLRIPNLPVPPASGNNNNGQSYALAVGGGIGKFGVRAQAKIPVRSFGSLFLGNIADYCVQAKATAVYDCTTRRARLVRINTFICPGPSDDALVCPSCPPST
jgi:hypothetical protein